MSVALMGRKIGMTQVYDEAGVLHPVTIVRLGPCQVLQVRTPERDGYHALQLGFEDKSRKKAPRCERVRMEKIQAEPKRFVREVRLEAAPEYEPGQMLSLDLCEGIERVDVLGTMKGRGTAGVMKRHGFSGLETTHGVLRKHRAAGSIGSNTSPGRVRKGVRMAGRHGACRRTVRNLKVVRLDKETGCMLIRGALPGPNGGMVYVRRTNKLN